MAISRVQRIAWAVGGVSLVALITYHVYDAATPRSGERPQPGVEDPYPARTHELSAKRNSCDLDVPPVPAGLSSTYARGWDGGLVTPLSPAEARARDRAGDPYVAVLHKGKTAKVVVRVAWDAGRMEIRTLDGNRAVAESVFHTDDDGQVFLHRQATAEDLDGEPSETNVIRTVTSVPGGRCSRIEDSAGSFHTSGIGERTELARPKFGRWRKVLEIAGVGRADLAGTAGRPRLPVSPGGVPWQPGSPLKPGDVAAMFTPGHEATEHGEPVRIKVIDAGEIDLPTGQLLATDPTYLNRELSDWEGPLTASVPPGKYPVELSNAVTVEKGRATTAGARITISDKPVKSWELGLREGQHLHDLGDGEAYGLGVDSGLASFSDPSAMSAVAKDAVRVGAEIEGNFAYVGNDRLVMWHAGYGDGSYPVWVGRDADGKVAQFVADMLILDGPDDLTAGP